MISAIVCGAGGRMGGRIVTLLSNVDNVTLVGAVERPGHPLMGKDIGESLGLGALKVPVVDSLSKVLEKGDVVIDFTHIDSALKHIEQVMAAGKAIVVGTTGFTKEHMEKVRTLAQNGRCLVAPNMSVGVNLLFKLAYDVAKTLGEDFDVEILEAHHNLKKDAPSGTAMKLGRQVAAALGRDLDTVGVYGRKGLVGARTKKEIGMQVIRGGDIVGEHTVFFIGTGERIELTHRATSRDNFARGAIRAALWLVNQPNGLYDMQDVLNLKIAQSPA